MGVIRRAVAATLIIGAGIVAVGPADPAEAQISGVTPMFECSAPNSDGTYTAFFSYKNNSSRSVDIPVGLRNWVIDGVIGSGQPTRFASGTHVAVFGVKFNKRTPPMWSLDFASARANTTKLCSAPAELSETGNWLALPAASLGSIALWGVLHRRRRGTTPTAVAPAA